MNRDQIIEAVFTAIQATGATRIDADLVALALPEEDTGEDFDCEPRTDLVPYNRP